MNWIRNKSDYYYSGFKAGINCEQQGLPNLQDSALQEWIVGFNHGFAIYVKNNGLKVTCNE